MIRIALLALALAGCAKREKPSIWDTQQELEILQLKDRVTTLEREEADRERLENIANGTVKTTR